MSQTKIVSILGPTGTGKTDSALVLADRFKGGVVNFDSRQMYRSIPVVTAQPTEEELSRCPHRLYGFLSPEHTIDAGSYMELGDKAIAETAGDGLLPILVGGTGMYLDALLFGLAPIPNVPEDIRKQVQTAWEFLGQDTMYGFLEQIDPEYADKIHPNDRQRITRALEVFEATGKEFSAWHKEHDVAAPRYDFVKIGIRMDLDTLTPRLALRIEKMLEAGAIEEMRRAFAEVPNENAHAWTGIGCAELIDFIKERKTLEEAKEVWLKRTRAYAKRQITWFKRDKGIHWFEPGDFDGMIELVDIFLTK